MPYSIIRSDITKYKGDAIVNSIGIDARVYGRVCKNILFIAGSEELTNYINSLTNNPVGSVYVTSGYNLPTKNIIHVVTPFRSSDDENCSKLKNTIKEIIDKAISLGCKSIAIPLLGNGANGYSKSEAEDAIIENVLDIIEKENSLEEDLINISIVLFDKVVDAEKAEKRKRENLNNREHCDRLVIRDFKMCSNFQEEKKRIKDNKTLEMMKFMNDINPDELIEVSPMKYTYPYDFIEDYIYYYDINDSKKMSKGGIDKRRKNQYKKARSIKTIDMFRIAVSLEMTKTHFVQFLIYSGKSLSPKSKLDQFIVDYYNGKYGTFPTVVKLDMALSNHGIKAHSDADI